MKQGNIGQLLVSGAACLFMSASMAANVANSADVRETTSASAAVSDAVSSKAKSGSAVTTATGVSSGQAVRADLISADQVVGEFGAFAGSRENALALVDGLHNSTAISLTATGQSGSSGSLSFVPPTRPMAYGEVRLALSLARDLLAERGVTKPTPALLKIALMGGTTISGSGSSSQTVGTSGVLELRSQGISWEKIGQTLNVSANGKLATDKHVAASGAAAVAVGRDNKAVIGSNNAVMDSHTRVGADVLSDRTSQIRTIGGTESAFGIGGQMGLIRGGDMSLGAGAVVGHGLGLGR